MKHSTVLKRLGFIISDGTFEGRGAAIFADGATGELSSLSNIVRHIETMLTQWERDIFNVALGSIPQ